MTPEQYDQKAKWDEYAILETAVEEAREEGIEIGIEKVVQHLILTFGYSDEQVATMANVTVDFVKAVRLRLNR